MARIGLFALGCGLVLVVGVGGYLLNRGDSVGSQPGDESLPRSATIRCTDTGTVVEPLRIAAADDGVHLEVSNETADGGTYLTYGMGGDPVPSTPTERVMTLPPGAYDLSCAHSPDMTEDPAVTLAVVDPHEFFEQVDAGEVLGCALGSGAESDGPTAHGATGRAAAEAWVAEFLPGATLTPAEGYRDDPARDFLVSSESERGQLEVFGADSGGFDAGLLSMC